MVRAWFMEPNPVNSRAPCELSPPEEASLDYLKQLGVNVDYLDPQTYKEELEPLARQRGYSYQDEVLITRESLPDYDSKVALFFKEHLHSDDEIRYVIDGRGYFDVRDGEDRWIRILSEPGDLITLPAGIYHRFSPNTEDYIQVRRLFQGVPVWTAHFREVPETKDMEVRNEYRQNYSVKAL